MKHVKATILSNKKVAPSVFKLALESSVIAKNAKPGQFVHVKCANGNEPLLRRPFGIHKIEGTKIELLYQVLGRGTDMLSKRKKDEILDIIGPLGNGFELNGNLKKHDIVLVAGGMGIAPIYSLAQHISKKFKMKKPDTCVILGAKTKYRVLCESDIRKLGLSAYIYTEDGSKGCKGLVTECLEKVLKNLKNPIIFACGPYKMLESVSKMAKSRGIKCFVSLEERMACAIGVCLGCPVEIYNDRNEPEIKMVCKDGPVFDSEKIKW
jgi:dihydroorotate dehydrogenase electron transfer subunit